MTLDEYFNGWTKVIDMNELFRILDIIPKVYNTKLVCPKQEDIFKAFNLCPYGDLKVVMLGQDPYPQKDVATGILFGNHSTIREDSLSPSLKVVKEAAVNFEIPRNGVIFDQTLESWASQGILMINSALTVEMNQVGSHVMLWRDFIANLLKNLSEWNSGIIYVLFGEQARTFKPYINSKTNIIIEEKHPAYYARVNQKMPTTVFDIVRKLSKEKYNTPIEWCKEF